MLATIIVLMTLTGGSYMFLNQKQFGKLPQNSRLERILNSPNYKNGAFQNLSPTPDIAEDASYYKIMKEFMNKTKDAEPSQVLPSIKTNLKELNSENPVIVWFGHSSYFIRIHGKNILVDPVFSGNASPVSFFAKNFDGSNTYSIDDFPHLDMVLITHDHYDHLDYETIIKLKEKTSHFYTSLGVGEHLEHWGIDPKKISEFDWWQEQAFDDSIKITAAPARHFSGRRFKRNQTLWASYILKTPSFSIYLGGDSGYDTHFKEIGEKHGPFDIALLECGQYNKSWPFIHMMPEQTAQAAIDLKTKVLLPVHWSKFTLALHSWTEPIERVTKKAQELNLKTTTPMIGEPIIIGSHYPDKTWWK